MDRTGVNRFLERLGHQPMFDRLEREGEDPEQRSPEPSSEERCHGPRPRRFLSSAAGNVQSLLQGTAGPFVAPEKQAHGRHLCCSRQPMTVQPSYSRSSNNLTAAIQWSLKARCCRTFVLNLQVGLHLVDWRYHGNRNQSCYHPCRHTRRNTGAPPSILDTLSIFRAWPLECQDNAVVGSEEDGVDRALSNQRRGDAFIEA
mmetsp:Transcript_1852/g.3569  ORF Transcript_1852/g.3569 Transcript_1852/m.3569 type:complete len:201 (+) Transcript_1852:326-928(+)